MSFPDLGLCLQGIKRRASHGVNEARIQMRRYSIPTVIVESYMERLYLILPIAA